MQRNEIYFQEMNSICPAIECNIRYKILTTNSIYTMSFIHVPLGRNNYNETREEHSYHCTSD